MRFHSLKVKDKQEFSTSEELTKLTMKRYNDKNDGNFYRSYRCITPSLILL